MAALPEQHSAEIVIGLKILTSIALYVDISSSMGYDFADWFESKAAQNPDEAGDKTRDAGDEVAEGEKARQEGIPRKKHKEESDKSNLPAKGEPNSSTDLLNPDGTVKQRRYYGPDGKAQQDIDFNHSDDGTHQFPHIHVWDWNKNPPRQKP